MSLDNTWWSRLAQPWKNAFAETVFRHTDAPTEDELAYLFKVPALRFAGPTAPYPNMPFELTDLSGLGSLVNLEILVVVHHAVESIEELSHLTRLKSLFLYENRIQDITSLLYLESLEQLYLHGNLIESIQPVSRLTNLKELYIANNLISSLAGLTEEHSEKLENFFCKPNDHLKQKEIIRVERDLGIRCKG